MMSPGPGKHTTQNGGAGRFQRIVTAVAARGASQRLDRQAVGHNRVYGASAASAASAPTRRIAAAAHAAPPISRPASALPSVAITSDGSRGSRAAGIEGEKQRKQRWRHH